jgi:hypothetical protein
LYIILGNKDECSDKHLGHCLAAIASGQTHRQAVAYATPWNSDWEDENVSDGASTMDERKVVLGKYWKIIEDVVRNIGKVAFHEIMDELQEPFYSDCLVYYLPTDAMTQSSSTTLDGATPSVINESPSSTDDPTDCSNDITNFSQISGVFI